MGVQWNSSTPGGGRKCRGVPSLCCWTSPGSSGSPCLCGKSLLPTNHGAPIAGRAILPLPTFNFRLSTSSRKRSQRLKRGKGWKRKRGVIEVGGGGASRETGQGEVGSAGCGVDCDEKSDSGDGEGGVE